MLSKPLGLALLVAGSMTAAAGGAYVAMRQQPPQPSAAASVPDTAQAAPAPASTPGATNLPGTPSAPTPSVGVETEAVTPRPAPAVKRRTPARPAPTQARRVEKPVQRYEPPVVPPDPEPVAAMPAPGARTSAPPVEPPPSQPRFEEITIPSDTVIGVQVDTTVSSERARVEDRVEGRVTRDVSVGGRVAIPAGTRMIGSVTLVERGGKFKDRARVAVRFHTAQLADGSHIPLQTTAIMREGDSPSRESAAKVGGAAVGGAILGAILGGGKGAMIGGSAGAAGGTAVVMAGDRNAATLPAGTTVTVRLMSDVAVTVER